MFMSNLNGSTSYVSDSVKKESSGENDVSKNVLCMKYKNLEKGCKSSPARKLHKSYLTAWNIDIATNGFARCLIATCNFISSNISSIQTHYRTCNGVPCYDKNFCNKCESYVPTFEELLSHVVDCKGLNKFRSQNCLIAGSMTKTAGKDSSHRLDGWEKQINAKGHAYCGYKQCNFVGMKLSDLVIHKKTCRGVENFTSFCCLRCRFRFPTDADRLTHQSSCHGRDKSFQTPSKKIDKLHFRVIQKLKRDSDEDCIIQPGPDFPLGQYRRRRPYTKQHKKSWLLSLEKCKYVKCIFQNCYFLAMSLEDMISHFGYCNGDGSFANFVCPHCKGRVTSEAILLKHIERSHMSKVSMSDENIKIESSTESADDGLQNEVEKLPEPSPVCNEGCKGNDCGIQDVSNCVEHEYTDSSAKNNEIKSEGMTENNTQNESVNQNEDPGKHFRTYSKKLRTKLDLEPEVPSSAEPKENINYDQDLKDSGQIEKENLNEKVESKPQPKKRGRKPRVREAEESTPSESKKGEKNGDEVKCGKCDFKGKRKRFNDHNLRKHVGLGWIEGEQPVNLEDEKEVIRLVKIAFKLTKKGTCEICQDVKKSFIGFVSHIQSCGKSAEEKHALKVQCPHCPAKYRKYSLPVHIKLCHSGGPPEEETFEEKSPETPCPSRKRQSALRAVSKFQQVLKESDESEVLKESNYFVFEKGTDKFPRLCPKLNYLWYKLKKEKKKIPCRHNSCSTSSSDVKEAKQHHFTCSELPEKVFMCGTCDFYSPDESEVESHIGVHRKFVKQRKVCVENEAKDDSVDDEPEDDEEDEEDDEEQEMIWEGDADDLESCDSSRYKKRKRKKSDSADEKAKKRKRNSYNYLIKGETDVEIHHKQNFCRRENIENIRGFQFYSKALNMTLEEERAEIEDSEPWPQLHTELKDWCHVPPEVTSFHFPELTESISVSFTNKAKKDVKWRKFKLFESDLTEDIPVMFTGGSVRSMSWCKISFRRMIEKTVKQYLALSISKNLDNLKNINEQSCVSNSSLLQIWNCGVLGNASASYKPEFSLGIVQEGGEIWDVAWFPEDTCAEGSEKRLSRLGLLATASEDGAVRIWSICDPSQLVHSNGLPIYETKPVVKLITDDNVEACCFRLSLGRGGLLAGGYSNGVLAVWNLKNISSPFCKKQGRCQIVKAHLVIQAHRTSITALTFCPSNNRYISSGALDRVVKLWDLESPSIPSEQYYRELCLDGIWTRNWPLIIYNFDEVIPNSNKGCVKFVRHVLSERHPPCMVLENMCMSLSFSDWLNTLCGCNNVGEIKITLLKSFIHDQKKREGQSVLSSVSVQKIEDENTEAEEIPYKSKSEKGNREVKGSKYIPSNYEEIQSTYGLVFKDEVTKETEMKEQAKSDQYHPEEFPIRAVNKVCFNPNFKSFTHIAVGYNCGLVRIFRLKDLQSSYSLKSFLNNVQSGKV